MSAARNKLQATTAALILGFVIYIPPAASKPVFGSPYTSHSPLSIQYTNEGLFIFFGQMQIFAPLPPDTLNRFPRQLREGIGTRLILSMVVSPMIIKVSSLLFAGARAHFWSSHLWHLLWDEWHGVINKAIPVLFENPFLRQRLFIRFVHELDDSRWEILRIPAALLPADQEHELNPMDWTLYNLWRVMDYRRLNRLELRWDIEGKGWLSEFDRDEKTRIYWPEVMSTTLEEALVAGEGQAVLQTLLHPDRLLKLAGFVIEAGFPDTPADPTPAIEWSAGRFASVLSFGDPAETQLAWLKDSVVFSWKDNSLILLRSGVPSQSLLDEINHPAMATWLYQFAPVTLPPAVVELLVLEVISALMDTIQGLWTNLIGWTASKMQIRHTNMAIVPKGLDNPSDWSRYIHQHPSRGKKKTGNSSGKGGASKDRPGNKKKQQGSHDRDRNNRSAGRGQQSGGGGTPPEKTGTSEALTSLMTSAKRGQKRQAPEALESPVTKRPRQDTDIHQDEPAIQVKKEPAEPFSWRNDASLFNPAKELSLADLKTKGLYFQWQYFPKKTGASKQWDLDEQIGVYLKLDDAKRKNWIEARVVPGIYSGQTFPKLVGQNELRAARELGKYEVLGHYGGVTVDGDGLERLSSEYGWGEVDKYLFQVDEDLFISAIEHSNAMSLINANHVYYDALADSCPGILEFGDGHEEANVVFLPATGRSMCCVFVVTLDEIKMGESIWADYGVDYWKRLYGREFVPGANAGQAVLSGPEEFSHLEERYANGRPNSCPRLNKLIELQDSYHTEAYEQAVAEYAICWKDKQHMAQRLNKFKVKVPVRPNGALSPGKKWEAGHINYLAWKYGGSANGIACHPRFSEQASSIRKMLKLMQPNHIDFEIILKQHIKKWANPASGRSAGRVALSLNIAGVPMVPRLEAQPPGGIQWRGLAVRRLMENDISESDLPSKPDYSMLQHLKAGTEEYKAVIYALFKKKKFNYKLFQHQWHDLEVKKGHIEVPVIQGFKLNPTSLDKPSFLLWFLHIKHDFKDLNYEEVNTKYIAVILKMFDSSTVNQKELYLPFLSLFFHRNSSSDSKLRKNIYLNGLIAPKGIQAFTLQNIRKLRGTLPAVEFRDGTAYPDGRFKPRTPTMSDDELSETESTDEEFTD